MATAESWAERCLAARYREAEEWATDYCQRVAQERAMWARREWKRLAVRLRRQRAARANRSGHRALSQCLRRGAGERYTGSTLVVAAEPWELELANAMEERFATIRLVAHNVSRFRMAVRQHAKLVREIAERRSREEDSCGQENLRGRLRSSMWPIGLTPPATSFQTALTALAAGFSATQTSCDRHDNDSSSHTAPRLITPTNASAENPSG